jgi:hypothetical protein
MPQHYNLLLVACPAAGCQAKGGLAGSAAHRFGAPATVVGRGIGWLLGALWFASRLSTLREKVRTIYVQFGILPEAPKISPITAGIQSVSELRVPPER